MFQDFVDGSVKTNKSWTVLVSTALQSLLLVCLIVVPLLNPELLPASNLKQILIAPPPPPPPAPPPPPVAAIKQKAAPKLFDDNVLRAPTHIPKVIPKIVDDELPVYNTGVVGVPGGTDYGVLGSVPITQIIAQAPRYAPPPPVETVKEAPKPAVPKRITVGGNVQQALIVFQPRPAYPALAKQARIAGTVRFTAVIGKDGAIQNLTLVSGHPLLVQSAQDAVKQWRYKPTLLNGEPVEVLTQIDVNFTLNQ